MKETKPPAGGQTPRMKISDYVSASGTLCPYCGRSDGLEAQGPPRHIGVEFVYPIVQDIHCLSCGRLWTELYQLVSLEERK
jgi:hypothetical protein